MFVGGGVGDHRERYDGPVGGGDHKMTVYGATGAADLLTRLDGGAGQFGISVFGEEVLLGPVGTYQRRKPSSLF